MNFFVAFFNAVFTYPLFNLLMLLYFWLGDFGLAIVVLTCLTLLLLLPLTLQQLRTAKVMRKLQPQVKALRQQYAGDQLAQERATQALYREHGIRRRSSFLSLLIQAPIYSGLYFALNTVLHASFVDTINQIMYPFLVHFASLPNIDLMWFTALNVSWHISLGMADPTHLLPLLTGVVTFVQMRMAQSVSLTETRDAFTHLSQSLQFLLLLISVGVTVIVLWQWAAGLALYRFVSLVVNVMVQIFTTGLPHVLPVTSNANGAVPLAREMLMQSPVSSKTRTKKRHVRSSSSRRSKHRRKGR